jgi:chromosomal replication initiator protein
MNDWDQIRNYLQRRVSADSFDNWLKGTACVGQEGDTLYVSVPDRETRLWLETEYSSLILKGIGELGLAVRRVSYETAAPRPVQAMTPPPPVSNGSTEADASSSALNPKFTFDSFVVGACNQFAHAAANRWRRTLRAATTHCFWRGYGQAHLMRTDRG